MRQENEGTHHADSHRNQLNNRTHRGRASLRSIKGALPFQNMTQKNVFGRPGRRRNLASRCDRFTAGFGPALFGSAPVVAGNPGSLCCAANTHISLDEFRP